MDTCPHLGWRCRTVDPTHSRRSDAVAVSDVVAESDVVAVSDTVAVSDAVAVSEVPSAEPIHGYLTSANRNSNDKYSRSMIRFSHALHDARIRPLNIPALQTNNRYSPTRAGTSYRTTRRLALELAARGASPRCENAGAADLHDRLLGADALSGDPAREDRASSATRTGGNATTRIPDRLLECCRRFAPSAEQDIRVRAR